MIDTIWLTVDQGKVISMTKRQPSLGRGQLPVKIRIMVDPSCWGSPTLEKEIHVTDWREGMTFPDVQLNDMVITQDEAARIVADRERQMAETLRARGYTIEPPVPPDDSEDVSSPEDPNSPH